MTYVSVLSALQIVMTFAIVVAALTVPFSDSTGTQQLFFSRTQANSYTPSVECLYEAPEGDCTKVFQRGTKSQYHKNVAGLGASCGEFYSSKTTFSGHHLRCRDAGGGKCNTHGKSGIMSKNCPKGRPPKRWMTDRQCHATALCLMCMHPGTSRAELTASKKCVNRWANVDRGKFPADQQKCVNEKMKLISEDFGGARLGLDPGPLHSAATPLLYPSHT